jgi:acetyltransferase-like isoleucine patch superfamily enzyme
VNDHLSTWGRVRRRVANERRSRELAARVSRELMPPAPSAFAAFGEGSVIAPPCRVSLPEAISIGSWVVIHEHAWISVVDAVPGYRPKLTIGDGTHIDRLCHIACVGEIEIGSHVLMGERVLIGDTYHRYDDPERPIIEQPMAVPQKVTIAEGCHVGLGALIMPGVTIGEHAYLGAGAVVTRDVPARTVVVGNPARAIRRYDPEEKCWKPCDGGESPATLP